MHATEPCPFDPEESQWPALSLTTVDPDGRLLDMDLALDHDLIGRFVGQMCQFEHETSDLWWDSLHNVLLALGLHRYIHSDIEPPDGQIPEAVDRWHRERKVVCELLVGSAYTLLLDLEVEAGYDASHPKFANPFYLYELLRQQMAPSLAAAHQIYQHVQALRPDQFEDVHIYLLELDRLYRRLDYHGVGIENPVWVWHCLDTLDRADAQWRRKLSVLETTRERQRGRKKMTTFQGMPPAYAEAAGSCAQTPAIVAPNAGGNQTELADGRWQSFDSWEDLLMVLEPKTRNLKLSGPEKKQTGAGMSSSGVQAGHGHGGKESGKAIVRVKNDMRSAKAATDNNPRGEVPHKKTDLQTQAQTRTKAKRGLPKMHHKTTPNVQRHLPDVGNSMDDFYDVMADLRLSDQLVADCDLDNDDDEDDEGGGYLGSMTRSQRESTIVVVGGERRRVIPGYAARKKKGGLHKAGKEIQQQFFRSKFPGRLPCAACTCQHPAETYAYCSVCDFCHRGGEAECWVQNPHLRGTRPLRETLRYT